MTREDAIRLIYSTHPVCDWMAALGSTPHDDHHAKVLSDMLHYMMEKQYDPIRAFNRVQSDYAAIVHFRHFRLK